MSQFVRNTFKTYRATNTIHLGRYQVDIKLNTTFDYDGYTIRYEGAIYEVPQLQGMFFMGWFVPEADTNTQYRSRPANVQVHSATPEGETRGASFSMGQASEEEAVVNTMDQSREIRVASTMDQNRLAVLREERRQAAARRAGLQNQDATQTEPETTFVQAQPVHGARPAEVAATPAELAAVQQADALNLARIAQAGAILDVADPRKTPDQLGGTRYDAPDQGARTGKYQLLREEQDDGVPVGRQYKFSGGASVGSQESARNAAKPVDVMHVASQQPLLVGNPVATSTPRVGGMGALLLQDDPTRPQAARAPSTTQIQRGEGNVGIDEISGDADAFEGEELEDLLPDAEVAGRLMPATQRAVQLPPKKSEAEEIQEIVAGWSTRRQWQHRVAEAVEYYGDWSEALEAICAIESDAVVKQIRTRLAKNIEG